MEKKFDADNLNERNYFYFEERFETYVVIYPFNIRNAKMITTKQLNAMRAFRDKSEHGYAIELWKEERMFDFITYDLADQILARLRKGEAIRFEFSRQEKEDVKEAASKFGKEYCNLVLSRQLDPVSHDYVDNAFKFSLQKESLFGTGAYGTNDWVHFYDNGTAAFSPTGSVKDVVKFNSFQDCVDFMRIK